MPAGVELQNIESWRLNGWSSILAIPGRTIPQSNVCVDRSGNFGFKIPCLVRSNGEVVDGHLRLKAARKLGITEIPVILCNEWSPAQVKAFG